MATKKPRECLIRYGMEWPRHYTELEIEIIGFRDGFEKYGVTTPTDRALHFKNIVAHYWGPGSKKEFVWNPWNEKMLDGLIKHKYIGLSGCASSGKSDMLAMWGLVNWLVAPFKTGVLATSTSLKDARNRIWGRIEEYFLAATDEDNNPLLPGHLVSSEGRIRSVDNGGKAKSGRCGMLLIPGDRAKEKENIGTIIGFHNDRVFFLCDEMPELSPALTEAADSNLIVNPYFQMVYSGNFKSIYDPFGEKCTPKNGWESVTEFDDEWETVKGGYCLRFDGLKSPNIVEGYNRYHGIYGPTDLQNQKDQCGEHSGKFWRMCRSFPCQEADVDHIYSEADLIMGDVKSKVTWAQQPVMIASLDPAWVTGGDRAMAYFMKLGKATNGKVTLQVEEVKEYHEDLRKRNESKPLQIAKQFVADCQEKHVPAENAAYDGSGGGLVFGALLGELWSTKILGVMFGGGASDRPASMKDTRPGHEAYVNRVTEIWFAGRDYMLSGQLKGIPSQCAKELCERRYDTIKGGGVRNRVEQKKDMKIRLKCSPDDADSFLVGLELAITRLGFRAIGMEGKRNVQQNSWKNKAKKVNSIYSRVSYEAEVAA